MVHSRLLNRDASPGGALTPSGQATDGRIRWLEPGDVRFFRDGSGAIRATVRSDRTVLRPALYRAFPISAPDSFIELREEGGQAVGMLKELAGLDPSSRELAEELLRERYVIPKIQMIEDIRSDFGMWVWRVKTDRGDREFAIRSPREDIRQIPLVGPAGGRIRKVRITDVDGNIYEIPDLYGLDDRSQALFHRIA